MFEESDPPCQVDRYGWLRPPCACSKRELRQFAIDQQKESSRAMKWHRMLQLAWPALRTRKLNSRLKKGIPDSIRSLAWQRLTDAAGQRARLPPMGALLERPEHASYEAIGLDVSRSFPGVIFFAQPHRVESLGRILRAYCQSDPVVGYAQGMNFIAGMLLAYMDEESAFYCFAGVMGGEVISHRGYFAPPFVRLRQAERMLRALVRKWAPGVLAHFGRVGVAFQLFSSQWFATAFQCMDWPTELRLRIFDRFLRYGTRWLLAFAVTIIMEHRNVLETGGIVDCMPALTRPNANGRMSNWHSVLRNAERYWIRKKDYQELLNETGTST
jgi:hypothetical protein